MYNTAKELHIGIDLGLQQINSNRKLSITPSEKDWVLNTVMMQEINNRINPDSNPKREGFEDSFKRIDDLESLKSTTRYEGSNQVANKMLYVYSRADAYDAYNPSEIFDFLPADYYKLIEARANVRYLGSVRSPVVRFANPSVSSSDNLYRTKYAVLKIAPTSDATKLYQDLVITVVNNSVAKTLFDLTATEQYKDSSGVATGSTYDLHGLNTMTSTEGRFQIIRLIIDYINSNTASTGVSAYWERFGHVYAKDSIVFVIDTYSLAWNLYSGTLASSDIYIHYTDGLVAETYDLHVLAQNYSGFGNYHVPCFSPKFCSLGVAYGGSSNAYYTAYTAKTSEFKTRKVRIVKSSELEDLKNHQYGKTIYTSPIGIIREGKLVVFQDSTFEINELNIEYYRRPKLISIINNQGCEITSDSFRAELVEKAVQKLSARLNDPNYPNLARENLILE